jgi:hypothetical protein
MVSETTTSLPPADVFARAKRFFAERVPHQAAFPEREGEHYLLLRGQGGEEIAFSARPLGGGTQVRGGTLLFGQVVDRFLTTLPPMAPEDA